MLKNILRLTTLSYLDLYFLWEPTVLSFSYTIGWDQSDNFMKLYVTVKGVETVPKENITCDFTDR